MTDNQLQKPAITWRDGCTPVSVRFDDPYFSMTNGLEETQHVFLAGNGLPDRFKPGFHIAELGFGTGLNMLATWQAWCESGQKTPLKFTSFEAFPMQVADIEKALSGFTTLAPLARQFLDVWAKGQTQFELDLLKVEIIVGDARLTLAKQTPLFDAWFLDGFSPAKNPELWQPGLLADVAAHTKPGGSFATYTAAGHIRRTLGDVGFRTDRVPGYGRKRHMTIGRLEDQP